MALYRQLAARLQGLIEAGTLQPGDKMPSVRRMSAQGQVSITTVLQAYRRLEQDGLIEARPQSGFYVNVAAKGQSHGQQPGPERVDAPVERLVMEMLCRSREEGVTSFATAYSTTSPASHERARRAWSASARRHPEALGQQGLPLGNEKLRRAIARRALAWGCHLDHGNILTTSGCTEAINLCLRAVTKPGDSVLVESPTSFRFLQILNSLSLRPVEVAVNAREGVSVAEVANLLTQHSIAAAVLMPTISNPMGVSLPDAAKRELVALLASHNVPLIEDHFFTDLHFGDFAPRAAKAYDTVGNVMICSPITKAMAPGLKAGWVEAGRWTDNVRLLKLAASGGQTELVELAIAELLQSPGYEQALRLVSRRFQASVAAAHEVINEHFPVDVRVSQPAGGCVLWIEFPHRVDSLVLSKSAAKRGIAVAPGPMFSASQQFRHCIRIGLCETWTGKHAESLREVGRLAAQMTG